MDDALALNAQAHGRATAQGAAHALCGTLGWDGEAPEWVHLLPLGPAIQGRDGRAWTLGDPDAVVAASAGPMVLDYEHATDLKAPKGEEAPAAAWFRELQVVREESAGRIPGIWGRVDWTPRGASAVQAHEYRFLSPVFRFDPSTNEIVSIERAGLTNNPNLDLKALNQAEPGKENGMKPELMTALCAMLGLAEAGATEDTILTALNTRAKTNLDTVPRAEYEAALNRAQTAETALKDQREAEHKRAVETALNQASEKGKITPAARATWEAMCGTPEELARCQAIWDASPELVPSATPTAARAAEDANRDPLELTEDEKALCRRDGISEDSMKAAKKALAARRGEEG